MNITFLIGNGFDLNLKLNTGYSDFYKYYIKNDPKDLLSKSIKEDFEKWSDLEIGLGEFLKDIDESQIEEFLDSKSTLEKMLSEYLSLECQRVAITDVNALGEEFREKVIEFYSDFNALDRDHHNRILSATREAINYQFITFNYTNILDRIISIVQKNFRPFSVHVANGVGYHDRAIMPHHIHGKLSEDLILGLDNAGQISNEKLKTNAKLTNYIIKSEVNKELGEKKIETAREIIDKSRYICLFGLSIGDTDAVWWKYIIEWLKRNDDNRLVLYINKNTNVQLSGQEKIRFRDFNREMMLERGRCTASEMMKQVREKIIVVPNSRIFNLKNIILKDTKNDRG